MLPNNLKTFVRSKVTGVVNTNFYNEYVTYSNINKLLYNPKNLMDSLFRHFEFKLEHNLKWNDLNSMYFSIELRTPFMDYRIVERNLSSTPGQLIQNGYTKWILRKAMENTLPDLIRHRKDKIGFENPSDEWFKTTFFKEVILDVLHSSRIRSCGYFNLNKLEKLTKMHFNGEINIQGELWKLINLHYFLNRI
jgi:asparagine synthase (glutamine-hydrolysing)